MLIVKKFKFIDLQIFILKPVLFQKTIIFIEGPAGIARVTLPFYQTLKISLENNFYKLCLFYSSTAPLKYINISQAVLNAMFTRVCFQNYRGLKTIGIGYRFVFSRSNRYLFISVGLTHLLAHRLNFYTKVVKLKKKKRLLILNSLDYNNFTNECVLIRRLRSPDVYCGKGLRLFHECYKLKEGKKQVR